MPVPAGPTRHRFSRARDPLEGGEVVEGRLRDRGHGEVELVEGLGDRERRGLEPGAGVGGVAGGDLGLDEGAQQLFGRPALGLRGAQHLGGESAHRGELEPAQPVDQVRAPATGAVGGHERRLVVAVASRDGVVGQWAGRDARAGRGPGRPRPGGVAGVPAPAARMDRTSAARHRPNATARASASRKARSPCAAPSVFSSTSSGPEAGVAGRGGTGDERLRDRAERAELLLRHGFRAHRPPRCGAWTAVVLVADRGLTRGDQRVFGDHLTLAGAGDDRQRPAVLDAQPRPGCRSAASAPSSGPSRTGRRRAGRPCGSPDRADAGPQRGQRGQQLPLDDQPLGRDRADLRVHRGVDLGAPRRGRGVRRGQVVERLPGAVDGPVTNSV